jgi:hypothetical protein
MSDQREYGPASYVNVAGIEIGYYPTVRANEIRAGDYTIIDREEVKVINVTTTDRYVDISCGTVDLHLITVRKRAGDMIPLTSVEPARSI